MKKKLLPCIFGLKLKLNSIFFKTFDGVKLFLPKRLDSQVIDAKHSETGANVKVHLNYKKEVGYEL